MNNFDPSRMLPPTTQGPDLTGFVALMQSQLQAQQPPAAPSLPSGSVVQGFPQMQMPVNAGVPAGVQQWPQGQFMWPPQQQQQQQQQQQIPRQQQQWGAQLQAMPQPALPNWQDVVASAYQVLMQQQQQQPQQQLYQPQPPPPPQPPTLKQQQAPLPSPVGSMIYDEARLIEALRSCKTQGITPRQALDQLHGVNNHSASEWKDYYLEHHDRLCSRLVKPSSSPERRLPGAAASSSQAPRSSNSTAERYAHPPQRQRPSESASTHSHYSTEKSRIRAPNMPKIPRSQGRRSSPPSSRRLDDAEDGDDDEDEDDEPEPSAPEHSNTPPPSGSRRTRRERIPEYHAGTRIPYTDGSSKPAPPPREIAGEGSKFTPAAHRFFIHYLRWRLMQDPLVTRETLYEELAKQTPSHDPDAWKRHWDNHPELPDKVVIEAGKRAVARGGARHRPPSSARPNVWHAQGGGSVPSGDEKDDEEDEPPQPIAPARNRGERRTKARRWQAVTDEDLRAMALYKLEKIDAGDWDEMGSRQLRWAEFAERPENQARRSMAAWCTIEGTHSEKLKAFYKALYAARRTTSVQKQPPPLSDSLAKESSQEVVNEKAPAEPTKSLPPDARVKAEPQPLSLAQPKNSPPEHDTSANPEGSRPRKRSSDAVDSQNGPPERKRPKEGTPPGVIVVSD